MDSTAALLGGGLLFSLVILVISVLVDALFLWIAAKVLKFKKQDFKTPIIVSIASLILTTILSFVLSFVLMFIPVFGVLLGLVLSVIVSIYISVYLIKYFYVVTWMDAVKAFCITLIPLILVFVLIVPLVLWQLGIF